MFDCDPRDYDSRDDGRHPSTANRGNRGTSADRARASTLRIELSHEPTQRGWSIRRHRHGVEVDGCHRLNPDIARAMSDPHALRAPEPAAGSVIDLRSFTPRGASRLVSPTTLASSPFVVRRRSSLVVLGPVLPAAVDRRGSSEEAMRNLQSDSELVRVDNQDRPALARPASRGRVSFPGGARGHPHDSADARSCRHQADAAVPEHHGRRTAEGDDRCVGAPASAAGRSASEPGPAEAGH